jgi:nicotinate-nucleotide--dimethylbenzimidazole phosphoribosyltransferase
MTAPSPLDDIKSLLSDLPPPDLEARAACEALLPEGLGNLASHVLWLAGWRTGAPSIDRPIFALYAASHSGFPSGRPELEALAAGEGLLPALAKSLGAGVEAFDLAVDKPVGDPAQGSTMTARECAATIAFGMEATAKRPDFLIVGDAAPGSEWAAGAVFERLWDEMSPPLEVLTNFGGRETAALLGAIVAARMQRIPVVLVGPAALAAAAVARAVNPAALDHCRASAMSGAADSLGLEGLSREDGMTGGAAALALLRLACAGARG